MFWDRKLKNAWYATRARGFLSRLNNGDGEQTQLDTLIEFEFKAQCDECATIVGIAASIRKPSKEVRQSASFRSKGIPSEPLPRIDALHLPILEEHHDRIRHTSAGKRGLSD